VEQLLDREEAQAIQRISAAAQHFGEDICRATDLRARIRRHPFLSTALGVGLGFFGGPFVLRTFRRILDATSSIPIPGSRPPYALPGFVFASLRRVYAPR
jgi:hypothetical protein